MPRLLLLTCFALVFFGAELYSVTKSLSAEKNAPSGITFKVKSTVEGYSARKRPILSYRFGDGDDTIVYFGVFHGDEGQGKEVLLRLMEEIGKNPGLTAGKRVIVVPVVNPDGHAKNRRTSARGVDLNRNFQTKDWTRRYSQKKFCPGTRKPEPETKTVLNILKKYKPDAVVTLHAYLHCDNFDGPAGALAFNMAKQNHYKVRSYIGYKTPGSFGTYVGKERDIPVITLEMSKTTLENSWDYHRDALLAVLKTGPSDRDALPDDGSVFSASAKGDLETLKALMKNDVSVHDRDAEGWTPLLFASFFGQTETVRWLLENGADPNQSDNNGGAPLLFAAQNDHEKIVELLLKNGAYVNAQDRFGNTALIEAARNANLDPLKILLAYGADIHMKDREGKCALLAAARGGYLQTVRLLLDNGADINAKDAFGRTALIEAAEHDYPSLAQVLLDRDADIRFKDIDGKNALALAKKINSRKIVAMLKKADRDRAPFDSVKEQDKTGK